MKGLEMVSNIKFIRMKEGKKSSLIFISQEERAVGTRASFFFFFANTANLPRIHQQRDSIPILQSAHYLSCGKLHLVCLLISTTL